MSKEIKTQTVYFVLMSGKTIELAIPEDNEEEIWEEIMTNFDTQGVWNCGNWPDLETHYLGEKLSHIDFHKILGMI